MKFLFTALCGLIACTCVQLAASAGIDLGSVSLEAQVGVLDNNNSRLTRNDTRAKNNVIHFLEWSRSIFPHGFGPLPPLDPFKLSRLEIVNIESANDEISGNLSLSNLVLRGAQEFDLQDVEVRLNISRADIVFNVPEYNAEVDVGVSVRVDEANFDLKSHASLSATNVTTKVSLQAVETVDDVYEVTALHLKIDADDVEVRLSNLRRTEGDSNEVILPNGIINAISNAVALSIAESSISQINEILRELSVDQVKALLLPD